MPTTTVADLKTCKRIKEAQIRLELSDDSSIRALASELETFREEEYLCNIVVVDAHSEHVRDWTSNEVVHLFQVLGELPHLVHLAFESLGTGSSEEEDNAAAAAASVFPVGLLTNLLRSTAPRLETLVLESCNLTGFSREELEGFAETIASCKGLRSCIVTSNFDLNLQEEDADEDFDPAYPLDEVITAISQLPLLIAADLVTYAWYEAGFPFQFNSAEPLKLLFQAPNLQEITLGEFHLANEGLKDVARGLETNQSLRRLELHFAPSPTRTSMASLTLLAQALKVNTCLEVFKMEFEESCPKLDSFLLKCAEAIATNRQSALQKLKVTSPLSYSSEVEDAFCQTLQSNYSLRRLEFMTILESGPEDEENYTCLDGAKRTEIELYLRLNRRGRKRLIQANGESRTKWVQTLHGYAQDLEALHYYIRRNPWLCQLEEITSTTMPMETEETSALAPQDTTAMLQSLQQLITTGFQSTHSEIQQLHTQMTIMKEQHALEKKLLQDQVQQLREEVLASKTNENDNKAKVIEGGMA